MLNCRSLTEKGTYDPFTPGSTKMTNIYDLPDITNFIALILRFAKETVSVTRWLEYSGHKINCNSVITTFFKEGSQFFPVL